VSEERELGLEDLLSGLAGEGQVISTGGDFTIHVSKAQEKLKKFQLPNPYFYILKLVQSAVLAGAKKIEVSCLPHQITFKHDGEPPAAHELRELLSFLLYSEQQMSGSRSLVRLAAAVNTAVACHARRLTVECCDGEERYQQDWSSSGSEFKELSGGTERGVRFTLKRKADDMASSLRHVGDTRLVDLVSGNRNAIQKEEAALRDRAIFCPVPIFLDGERISRTAFGVPRFPNCGKNLRSSVPFFHWYRNKEHYVDRRCHKRFHLIQAYYPAEPNGPPNLVAPPRANSFLISEEHPHRPGQPCSLILGWEANRSLPNRTNFIKEGVLINQKSDNFKVSGMFCLVCVQHLETDLTGFQLRGGEEYSRVLNSVGLAIQELREEHDRRAHELRRVFSA